MIRLTARDIMNEEVLAVSSSWSIDRLVGFLVENAISGAPVISEEGNLVGVVSLTDILRQSSLSAKESQRDDLHDYYTRATECGHTADEFSQLPIDAETPITVRAIMTPVVFDVKEDTTVQQVAAVMLRGGVHRVLVTRGGRPVGIITTLDMLKLIRDL